MSNPDAAAGPYAGNEKKPIGGNIMAHASTTRYVHPGVGQGGKLKSPPAFSSRSPGGIPGHARSTIHPASPRWKRTSLFLLAVLAIPRKKYKPISSASTLLHSTEALYHAWYHILVCGIHILYYMITMQLLKRHTTASYITEYRPVEWSKMIS